MYTPSPAFKTILDHTLRGIASADAPSIFTAHLHAEIEVASEEVADAESDSGSDTSSNPSTILGSDDNDDAPESPASEVDERELFEEKPVRCFPMHVVYECFNPKRVRKVPFRRGVPSPLRNSWTAEDLENDRGAELEVKGACLEVKSKQKLVTTFSLDDDDEPLEALGDITSFFANPITPALSSDWADDDSDGSEEFTANDLQSYFATQYAKFAAAA